MICFHFSIFEPLETAYVIELTCIGPKIKEVFKSKELAAQYTIALHKNYPDKHYQIAKAELDMDGIE